MDLLRTVGLVCVQYRAFRSALAELQGCSTAELSRRGINRGDIARTAYAAAERRVSEAPTQWPEPLQPAHTIAI